MAKASPPTVRVGSPAVQFRSEIAAALAEGVGHDGLTLRLTLGDTYRLTRDGDTPVDDISYAGGVMRFLGVKVEKGGVPESVLVRDVG
jgi:hypothetical protein